MEALRGVRVGQVISDGLAIFALGLDNRLAFVRLVQHTFGAFGLAGDGDFFARPGGKGRSSQCEQEQACDAGEEKRCFFHRNCD